MKNRIFFGGLLILFIIELAVLTWFAFSKTEKLQDTVAVNEILQTLKMNWDSLEEHVNHTTLDYVVLNSNGTVLYQTKSGLSESVNAAISHKDTILDIETKGSSVGKLIVYNNDALILQSEKQGTIFAIIAVMLIQCCICTGYFFLCSVRL